MNQKSERKKSVRPKTEGQIKHISQPFDFSHDLHIGHDNNVEGRADIDDRPVSPPAPCPGNKDKLGNTAVTEANITRVIKDEILPVLRVEIGDIVEEKVRKVLNEHSEKLNNPHCRTCMCVEKERPNNADSTHNPECEIGFNENPKPCTAIFVEDGDNIKNTAGVNVIAATDIQVLEGKRKFLKSFSNPVYHHKRHTLLIQTQHGVKLMKYGSSDTQHVQEESSARDDNSFYSQSNTLNALAKPGQPRELKPNEIHSRKGKLLSRSDERECLAGALQWHIKELVDGIVFKDSELPDELLADGCITEDECAGLRSKLDRKGQVRVLLSLIKGRDVNILKKFVKHLRTHNESVANSIEEKFEQNKKDGKRCTKCALCKLTSQVNLKYIVDDLWRNDLIDDGLFNLIVQTDRPTGAQDEFWYGVIYSLNNYCVQCPADIRHTLGNALKKKNHYDHLAQAVERMIYTKGALECCCELQSNIVPVEIFSSMISSRSPRSSVSEFETDSQSDISNLNNQKGNVNPKEPAQEATKPKENAPVDTYSLQDNILSEENNSSMTIPKTAFERRRFQDSNIPENNDLLILALKQEGEPNRLQDDIKSKERSSIHMTTAKSESEQIWRLDDNMPKENNSFMATSKPEPENDQTPPLVNKPVPLRRQSVTRQMAVLTDEWEIADVLEYKL